MNKPSYPVTPYQCGHEHFIFRSAHAEDAPALAELKTLVWPDDESDPDQIAVAVNSADHLTLLAEYSGKPVAFADSFWTDGSSGPRWEVDLLAASPHFRGRRLGEALVRSGIQAVKPVFSRALIQLTNIASQTSFARCGFTCMEPVNRLYVSHEPLSERATASAKACLVKVSTMSYRGIWLENSFTRQDLLAARSQIRDGEIAGAVIPASQQEFCRGAEECGYHFVAEYQWWVNRIFKRATIDLL